MNTLALAIKFKGIKPDNGASPRGSAYDCNASRHGIAMASEIGTLECHVRDLCGVTNAPIDSTVPLSESLHRAQGDRSSCGSLERLRMRLTSEASSARDEPEAHPQTP